MLSKPWSVRSFVVAFCSLQAKSVLPKQRIFTNAGIVLSALCLLPAGACAQSVESVPPSARVAVHIGAPGDGSPGVTAVIGAPSRARNSSIGRSATASTSTPVAAIPQFSLAAGSYPSAQSLTITDATPGATIYYSTNGTIPSASSSVYSGAITVSASEVVVAIATAPGYTVSPFNMAGYFIATSSSRFIYTLAGNDSWGYTGDGGSATLAQINEPFGTAMDSTGNLYIVDDGNNAIRKIAANTGIITTIAGNGVAGHTGDNGPASSAELYWPTAIAIDGSDNIYVAEVGDDVIRRIDASSGVISTYASGLLNVYALALDTAGNLYVAGGLNIIKIAAGTGTPTIFAAISNAHGVALDSLGNLYATDPNNHVIRKVAAGTGIVTIVAGVSGGGCASTSGDGGPALNASLCNPAQIGIDGQNNLYFADAANGVIQEVDAQTGIINTIAGVWRQAQTLSGDGYPATDVWLPDPRFISVDAAGNVYLSSSSVSRVQKITVLGAPPTQTTPTPTFSLPSGSYASPQTVSVSDTAPGAAYYVSLFDDGSYAPAEAITNREGFHGAFDVIGSIDMTVVAVAPGYLPSAPATASYSITSTPTTVISTIAGDGSRGFPQSGGPATGVGIGMPSGVAIDRGGNVYIADVNNNVVYKKDAATGNLSLVAGTGSGGYSGDNGPATSAQLNSPSGLAVDASGNVYIADNFNDRVRMVSAQTGIITTIAGPGSAASLGDGGPATQAYLAQPAGLAFDSAGNLYIADSFNDRIRMIAAQTGIISTVAGGGNGIQLGDGGPATQATLDYPTGLAIDSSGNIYIADQNNGRIRVVTAQTGIITTIGGNGDQGTDGDGGPATQAEVWPGLGIAVDAQGNVYASSWPGEVRKISKADGTITLYAGNGYCSWGGDGGSATVAGLCEPQGLALDSGGSLYISDFFNARIRKATVNNTPVAATPVISLPSGTYSSQQTVAITDATANATIYYTTDGTTPTTGSTVYSGPITVSHNETLQAIAVASGYGTSAVASATYTINVPVATTPTVTVVPASSSVSTNQTLSVAVTVSGGAGNPTPTGSVTLASGSYSSGAVALSGGSATISIPAGSLSTGSDTLTAAYAPDSASTAVYNNASGTAAVSVVAATFSMSASAVTITPGGSGTSTVTVSSTTGYAGAVSFTCAVTSSPAGAIDTPSCTVSQTVTLSASATSGTATVSVNSTAASASMSVPLFDDGKRWAAGGGAALAAILFFLVPRRRRLLRTLAGLALVAAFAGSLAACGGGGGTKSTQQMNPGTTAGAYTITVTGTGNDVAKTTTTATFTLTVH